MVTVTRAKADKSLRSAVEKIAGVDLGVCLQCRKCSSGCPVGKLAKSRPSEIIRRLHLKAGDELLESDLVWMCVSCETCSTRCPMDIDVAGVMDALRKLAVERGASKQKGNVQLFNKSFLKTVEIFGRTYDMAMIAAYKAGSGKFMDDTEKFPTMLAKGKIALLPTFAGNRKTVKRVFNTIKRKKKAGI